MTNVRWGDERGPHQASACQGGQPLGITDVRLAARHILDMTRIAPPGRDAHLLQGRIGALPVDPRAFHDHHVRSESINPLCPLCQGPAIPLETTKLSMLHGDTAIGLLDQGTGRARQSGVRVNGGGSS